MHTEVFNQKTTAKQPAFIQPKLMVNAPNDVYEQEADAVADRVMRMPLVSSKAQGAQGMLASSVQRKCSHCEEEEKKKPIMRKAESGGGFETSSAFASQLSNTRGGGQALPNETKAFMESRFSRDFSNVRVHTDGQAAGMNRAIQAKAFTHGSDIYFNSGQFEPNTERGKRLLAHELTHTVQQGNGIDRKVQRQPFDPVPLPPPTSSIVIRLNDQGRIEVLASTPELPVTGSLGLGFRCENGRCQPIAGQSSFLDATKDTYSIDDAMRLLGGFGAGSGTHAPSTPLLLGGSSSRLPSLLSLPCEHGWQRSSLGICHPISRPSPTLQGGNSLLLSPPSLTSGQPSGLGQLHSTIIDHFPQNNAQPPSQADDMLEPLVSAINSLPSSAMVFVYGHASTEGTAQLNQTLSLERANAVKERLIALGVINADKLRTEGRGEDEPSVTPERTEEQRARNRRVEVWFFDHSGPISLRPPVLPPLVQPKLLVNAPNDPYEREADTVADKVMRMPEQQTVNQKQNTEGGKQLLAHEMVQREPEMTRAEIARDDHLRRLSVWPSEAHSEWRRLRPGERSIVVTYMTLRYGTDFASEFYRIAQLRRRPDPVDYYTNVLTETPQQLRARGYRFVVTSWGIEHWVHPSGNTINRVLPSTRTSTQPVQPPVAPQQPPSVVPEDERQDRCAYPCMDSSADEDECRTCCEESIPESDFHCRTACEFACSMML